MKLAPFNTRLAALKAIGPAKIPLRAKVFHYIHTQGKSGATDEEVAPGLSMRDNTVRPRRNELETDGVVIDSGQRRKTTSGREAIVWISLSTKLGRMIT